jgi:glycosyltransferase involved in cell wall biosynthesis
LRGLDYLVSRLEAIRGQRIAADMRILVWDCGTGQVVLPLASLGYRVVGVSDEFQALDKAREAARELGLDGASFGETIPTDERFDAVILDGSYGLRPFTLGQMRRLADATKTDAVLLAWQAATQGFPRRRLFRLLRVSGWKVQDLQEAGSFLRSTAGWSRHWLKRKSSAFHSLDKLDGWLADRGCPALGRGCLVLAKRFDPNKRQVVHIIDSLNPGGAERLVLELAKRLPDHGVAPQVLAVLGGGELEAEFQAAGVPVVVLGYSWPFGIDTVWKIYRYLKLNEPDAVHTHLFASDVYGRLAARLAGIKCVIGTEHNVNRDFGRIRRLAKRLANRWASRLIAISRGVQDWMATAEGADQAKIALIPNGIDLERVSERPARHFRDIPRLLTVCRLSRQKDLATLVKALALVKESWILQIAGVGESEGELKALVRRLGLESRVEFLGYREDVPELLAQADLFCLPSRYEGQGLAVLEAAAAGVPLVLSDLAVFREFLKKDEAIFVEPGHVPAWAEALRGALREPERLVARAQTAKSRLRETSGISRMVKAYADVYGQACPAPKPRSDQPRVIHVLPTLYPGGAERLVYGLVKLLPTHGFKAEAVAVYGGGALEQDFREAGLEHAVYERGGPLNAVAFFRLWRHFRQAKPDIVHVHLFGADIWGRLAAWAARVPLVVSTEHNVNLDHGWDEITVKRILAGWTDGFIAVSGMARENMVRREKLPSGKILTIRNGVEMGNLPPRIPGPCHEPARLLNVGRLSEQKDQATLLRAVAGLNRIWVLDLAGTGELESELKRLADDLGVLGRVSFLGFRRDIGELLKNSDVYVSTSRWEGLALTAIEAAAAGVPLVLPDIAASYEVVKRGEAEFVAPGDAAGFSRAIARCLDDYPAMLRRAESVAGRVRRDLSVDRMVVEYADFYRTLIASK